MSAAPCEPRWVPADAATISHGSVGETREWDTVGNAAWNIASNLDCLSKTRELDSIRAGMFLFELRKPIQIRVYVEDGICTVENSTLGLQGYGESYSEAIEMFEDRFEYMWREIASEEDQCLEGRARELKKRLTALVSKIFVLQQPQHPDH